MNAQFTGRHMLLLLLAFFGIVVAVNVTMATLASRTFGGLIVANGYVASRDYNGWLRDARSQDQLGWDFDAGRAGDRLELTAVASGRPLTGLAVSAVAVHPLGVGEDRALRFQSIASGRYRSIESLPPGRWRVHVEARRGGDRFRAVRDISE